MSSVLQRRQSVSSVLQGRQSESSVLQGQQSVSSVLQRRQSVSSVLQGRQSVSSVLLRRQSRQSCRGGNWGSDVLCWNISYATPLYYTHDIIYKPFIIFYSAMLIICKLTLRVTARNLKTFLLSTSTYIVDYSRTLFEF